MNIVYLSVKEGTPAQGYWDQAFLADLLSDLPEGDRTPVVIPGAYQGDVVDQINVELAKYHKVMVFVTSDEEGKFPVAKLQHPDMVVYSQYGTSENVFPLGYTPQARPVLKEIGLIPKVYKWCFMGQITHERRQLMAEQLKKMDGGYFLGTDGFAKGLEPKSYFEKMAQSNCVICPPGALTQDSFRVYEALEAGSVPIVDKYSSLGAVGYWEQLFPEAPFPVLSDYSELPELVNKCENVEFRNQVFSWWIWKKKSLKNDLKRMLGIGSEITVVMPTSPIPSHPSTEVIDETIKSVRHHLDSDIVITVDAVRAEQVEIKDKYNDYIRRLLWNCNFKHQNIIPILFTVHSHQSGMMKTIIPFIRTPLILYVEHDTPLVIDEPIDWEFLKEQIRNQRAHVIRFHFEAHIPEEHKYLMIGETEDHLQKTVQWSQRPHLARTDFYREAMNFFSEESNCFIEDKLYGELIHDWDFRGMPAWENWKLFIYIPDEKNIKRSLNLDGRQQDKKFDDRQIW